MGVASGERVVFLAVACQPGSTLDVTARKCTYALLEARGPAVYHLPAAFAHESLRTKIIALRPGACRLGTWSFWRASVPAWVFLPRADGLTATARLDRCWAG